MAFKRKDTLPPGTDIARLAPPQPSAVTPADVTTAGSLAIPDHLLEQVVAEVRKIPEAGEDGQFGILTQLLSAETFGDLNKPWEATPGRSLAGRRLRISGVTRRPSEFDGGPEIFLVVDSADLATGERVTWTTSALAVIVQLAAAHNRGWLPLTADITAAKKPTKRGFLPYHLNIVSVRDGQ